MGLLFKDAWHTKSRKDKLRIWFMPTGWRPADVEERFPVYKIDDVYDFEKYDTPYSKPFLVWSWFQLIVLLLTVSWLFGNIAAIGTPGMFFYGAFIFLFVYAFTELMDGNRFAFVWGLLYAAAGAGVLLYTGDWFGISSLHPLLKYFILGYFILSVGGTLWFTVTKSGRQRDGMALG